MTNRLLSAGMRGIRGMPLDLDTIYIIGLDRKRRGRSASST